VPAAARRIERLRLTAQAEEGLTRGRLLVEDAMRIASFPGETEGRVVVIRQLALGIVDPDRSSAALAPVIEEAVRSASARALRFDDPAAPAADVVYFPSALAAAGAFVERLVGGGGTEWFWESLFESRISRAEPEAAVHIAVDRLLELPGGAVHVAALVNVLRVRGTVDRLLGWLRPGDGERLLTECGLPLTPRHRGPSAPARVAEGAVETGQPRLPPESLGGAVRAWYPMLATWSARWSDTDPRTRWLAAAALVGTQPSMLAHSELQVLSEVVLRAAQRAQVAPSPPQVSGAGRRRPRQRGSPSLDAPPRLERSKAEGSPIGEINLPPRIDNAMEASSVPKISVPPEVPRANGGVTPSPGARAAAKTPADSVIEESAGSATPSWEFDFRPTISGGLLFVLPVLSKLGIDEALRLNQILVETEFPQRFLLHLADRLMVPDTDAMRAALAPRDPQPEVPADWDRLLGSWLTRVRRTVHRAAGMGLRALVARAGQVAATRTHIDVVLQLRDLDIRVRRAGLDIDPGWVPWLGRVVSFRYEGEP
jgi:hypothetical protein